MHLRSWTGWMGLHRASVFQGITNAAMSSVLKSSSALIMSLGGHVVLNCPYTAQLHQNVSGCWAFPWFSVSHELMRNSILWFPRWRTPVLPRPPQRGAEPFNPPVRDYASLAHWGLLKTVFLFKGVNQQVEISGLWGKERNTSANVSSSHHSHTDTCQLLVIRS